MIFDHLKPRPVQRDKKYFSKSKRSLKGRHYLCNAQKSGQRDSSSNSWERNGRKCRHVYVVINPDLQAQDQPKGKQNRKEKFIQSAIVFFFFFLSSPCVTIIAIRIASAADARQTNFSSASFQPGHFSSGQRATKHERRRCLSAFEQTWDASWWSADFFEHITFLFVCLFSFLLLFFFWKIILMPDMEEII